MNQIRPAKFETVPTAPAAGQTESPGFVDAAPTNKPEEIGASCEREGSDASQSVASAVGHLGEIVAGFQTLLALRVERRRMALRGYVIAAIVVLLGAVAVVPLIMGGALLLLAGLAQGFTVMWGDRVWLGNLTTGTVILGGIVVLAWVGSVYVSRKESARKTAKYGDIAYEGEEDTETNGRQDAAVASNRA